MSPGLVAIIVAIIGPICGALGWLYRESRKVKASHQQCEIKLARLGAQLVSAKSRIRGLEGSVETLTNLLKREIHLG